MKKILFLLAIMIGFSCNQQSEKPQADAYSLQPVDEYINLPIDEDTYVPRSEIAHFELNGTEYIAFQNSQEPQILIYNLDKRVLEKKITYQQEGANGIGRYIYDFHIKNFDEIFLLPSHRQVIYKTDGKGRLLHKYNMETMTDGLLIGPIVTSMGKMVLFGSKFYIVQDVNKSFGNDLIEKSGVGITLDTLNNEVKMLPMKHLALISYEDLHTNAAFGHHFRRTFDGENFLYSFHYSDSVFRVSPDHKRMERYQIKSKYITEVKNPQSRSVDIDYKKIFELNCEAATYEFIVYDKYREVYYRMAHPKTEVDPKDDHLEVLRSGKKQTTIMILDKELNVIGETLLPEYTYVPDVYLVREDGLYLSCSHIHNPNYSDDVLSLQKLVLTQK